MFTVDKFIYEIVNTEQKYGTDLVQEQGISSRNCKEANKESKLASHFTTSAPISKDVNVV